MGGTYDRAAWAVTLGDHESGGGIMGGGIIKLTVRARGKCFVCGAELDVEGEPDEQRVALPAGWVYVGGFLICPRHEVRLAGGDWRVVDRGMDGLVASD